MNTTIRTLILVTLVGVGAFAGTTVATSHASISASPATPGETSTHTAMLTVQAESAGSLDGFALDYSDADVNVDNVSAENVTVGIDRAGDSEGTEVDEDISADLTSVEASEDGMLNLTLGGSYELSEGDQIIVQVEGVQNPEAGEYTIGMDINPGSSGGEAEAMLNVSESGDGSSTANETETEMGDTTETETETEMGDTTETETETDGGAVEDTETELGETEGTGTLGEDETITEGPGFGVVAAALAMLVAVVVAVRRQR